ncbi:MAG: hypothetical protein HKN86_04025 [Acidimicrobiia bacterium]|nr:hypothetical protein [Acidimicrobiia bacterium]
MSKILIGIIIVMGLGGWFLYNQNQELVELNKAFELRDAEQQATISAIQQRMETTQRALQGLQVKNQKYEEEMAEYLDIFRRHNLAKLASAKPGLIEPSVNKRTKEVFDEIEAISINISSLND